MGTGKELRGLNNYNSDDIFAYLEVMNCFKSQDPQEVGQCLNKFPMLCAKVGLMSSSSPISNSIATDDSDIFSNLCLKYINQILNQEEMDEKLDMLKWHPCLEATEKPFYDILGEKYPPPPYQSTLYNSSISERSDGSLKVNSSIDSGIGAFDFLSHRSYPVSIGYSLDSFSQVLEEALLLEVGDRGIFSELCKSQFLKGVDEARKFLPSKDKLVSDLESDGFSLHPESIEDNGLSEVKVEKLERDFPIYHSKGQKNRHRDDLGLEEGRSNKQSAVDYSEEALRSEMLDMVLLGHECKSYKVASPLYRLSQNEVSRYPLSSQIKGSGSRRGCGRMQLTNETVDLTTLLIHCAQAISIDDHHCTNESLKQIRQHASPFGDGMQRLAVCFADGLEARMAGMGTQRYCSIVGKPVTATEVVKAYQLYMGACPFKRISYFFSSQMILKTVEKASAVHIIDFGIHFGFQWPSFFQSLSRRHGRPPKIKITGIETPQPGFRPMERVEQTGRRLMEYARSFNVPFEYHAISAQWETIRAEDLDIREGEMLIVNCLFRLKNIADETEEVECPRDRVLKMINKLNPSIFIHGIVNGSYNAPFFLTRFRQALFHFSALSDMLETTIKGEDPNRPMLERDMFGQEALNVIACEGSSRVERPETYKQWQVRNLRAGFVQLPLDRNITKKAIDKVQSCYHKDFVTDEDSRWLLQGWKGRILYALSVWRPNNV